MLPVENSKGIATHNQSAFKIRNIFFEMLFINNINNVSAVRSQKPDQGQSKAVGAQIGKWSGQQYQSGIGQQPTGHEV